MPGFEMPKSLSEIPGMARCGLDELTKIGIKRLSDLQGEDPIQLYIDNKDNADEPMALFNALMLGCTFANLEDQDGNMFWTLMTVPNMYEIAAYALKVGNYSIRDIKTASPVQVFEDVFAKVPLGVHDWVLVYYSILMAKGFTKDDMAPGPWIPWTTN
jgi:hypothetical protein